VPQANHRFMKQILATSKTCGPCQVLKKQIEKLNLTVETKDYSNPSDIPWFREKSIRTVPVLVIENDEGHILETVSGIEDILNKIKSE
jgi:glutaredoxin